MATLFGGFAGKDRSGYALALFPGASYTTRWDATSVANANTRYDQAPRSVMTKREKSTPPTTPTTTCTTGTY